MEKRRDTDRGGGLLIHLPIIRHGRAYRSLDTQTIFDPASSQVLAEISLANTGLIRIDAREKKKLATSFRNHPSSEILGIIREAGEIFLNADLEIGPEGPKTSFESYLDQVSASTGLPKEICRGHGHRLRGALVHIRETVNALTNGLSDEALDTYLRDSPSQLADNLGIVLPSNAPGVNGLWFPLIAFRTPIAIKPGHADPWTPLRLIAAFVKAGIPAEFFSFYPSDHAGGRALLLSRDTGIIFGSDQTTALYKNNPKIQRNGAGYSKVLFDSRSSLEAHDYLPFLKECVVYNGGRSCTNTSTIVLSSGAEKLARSLAEELLEIEALPLNSKGAILGGYSDAAIPNAISEALDRALEIPGAKDISLQERGSSRVQEAQGLHFLLPTVIHCSDREHPLAQSEYPFPMVSIVECPEGELETWLGNTLALTLISDQEELLRELQKSPKVSTLRHGPVPTTTNRWESPHIGNLFELLRLDEKNSGDMT